MSSSKSKKCAVYYTPRRGVALHTTQYTILIYYNSGKVTMEVTNEGGGDLMFGEMMSSGRKKNA